MMMKPRLEADASWSLHLERQQQQQKQPNNEEDLDLDLFEEEEEYDEEGTSRWSDFWNRQLRKKKKKTKTKKKKHKDYYGISETTVHAMMIDAGSTGSRLHVYEFKPRVIARQRDVELVLQGKLLRYPETNSRWTARLRPGIETFGSLPDSQLRDALADYLRPLMDFAKDVLAPKSKEFASFPIFLKATGGVRTLPPTNRFRIMTVVRSLFADKTYCPFSYEYDRVRVISGEEEAIYGWTGVNFVTGTLLPTSEGSGTVINPALTYGAMDMGGASTQISFYDPNEDVMSNLFKLQIGRAKHWNVYVHSFLYYGINEARNRFEAFLLAQNNATDAEIEVVYNPCLPGKSEKEVHTSIHLNTRGIETWNYTTGETADFAGLLRNNKKGGDFDECSRLVKQLLHKPLNDWCDFEHRGYCSFVGVYQPDLPKQERNHFGEFLAFSNYYHVWEFLQELPERASMAQLRDQARYACSMSREELVKFNNGTVDDDELDDYCFKSAYVFNVLHHGYGFELDEYVTFAEVVNGQKVGWPLGAILYEINTLPWEIERGMTCQYHRHHRHHHRHHALELLGHANPVALHSPPTLWLFVLLVAVACAAFFMWTKRSPTSRRNRQEYEPVD